MPNIRRENKIDLTYGDFRGIRPDGSLVLFYNEDNLPGGSGGATGPAGPQGIVGPTGPSGATGPTGATGPQGDAGTTGPQGLQGDAGVAGPQGLQGPAGGGGLSGTRYVFVAADGTPIENAAELESVYTTAIGMTATSSSRVIVLVAPGDFDFEESSFILNTDYVDLVSLDGNRSISFINSGDELKVTGNDVFVKGVMSVGSIRVSSNRPLVKFENCLVTGSGDCNFGDFGNSIINGTFIDCEGPSTSFSGDDNTSNASGIFIRCKGGNNSFGRLASGTFTDCVGGDGSFGSNGSSGTFTDCVGGIDSFGGEEGIASGVFIRCQGGSDSFGYAGASGTFTYCIGGDGSFSSNGAASGTFSYCIGGDISFGGGDNGTLTGKALWCRRRTGSFPTVSGGGRTVLCINGDLTQNNQ